MPDSPDQISNKKQKFISDAQARLVKSAEEIQKRLARRVSAIISSLETNTDGTIALTDENMAKLSQIDTVFRNVTRGEMVVLGGSIVNHMSRIEGMNKRYFQQLVRGKTSDKALASTVSKRLLRAELGLSSTGVIKTGGFLDRFITDTSLRDEIKRKLYGDIVGTNSLEKSVKEISETLTGTKQKNGGIVRHVKTYVTDSYNQFDAAVGNIYAKKLELNFFRYRNSLVAESRCFCKHRAQQVFHRSEAKRWKSSTSTKATKGPGKSCKAIYEASSYSPLIHRGGYNCRHVIDWISNSRAKRIRPEVVNLFPEEFQKAA